MTLGVLYIYKYIYKNAWYVAEIASRITDRFKAIRILNEPIVLFRTKAGS